MDGVTRLSAATLRAMIAARALSPVELLDASLAEIARLNPRLNAIVTLDEASARAAALAAEDAVMRGAPLGVLHGLPVLVKDITPTAGLRTTYGSPLYKDNVPTEDAEVVARLRRAGAIILGKTNTPEFAAGAHTVNALFGVTRNPWNPALSPAGSSGGSAVAVATGMAPLAQGTDFGGSLRVPAAFCGIVGLRTTVGLVPNRPEALPWHWGQVNGPLARTAEDAALMLDAIAGFDPLWPISVPTLWQSAQALVAATRDAKGLRITYAPDIARLGVEPDIAAACRAAALSLEEAGATVDMIDFDASAGFDAYKVLRAEWMVGQQWKHRDRLDALGPILGGNVRKGLDLTVRETAAAAQAQAALLATFRTLFGRYDFLLTPTVPVGPFPVTQPYVDTIAGRKLDDYIDWIASAFLVTFVGFPAASVPAGLSAAGLPIGLQIVGPRLSEPRILGLAKLVQASRPLPPLTPDVEVPADS
jgi:amidase